jgi:hypothetical protein
MNHRLVNVDGTLYFPKGGVDNDLKRQADEPSLLLCVYDAGDCDTIPWPLESAHASTEVLCHRLAAALYDERETNDHFGVDDTIELPDGTPFDFDTELTK